MFFLVFGVRPRRRRAEPPRSRTLPCPGCGMERTFAEQEIRSFLEVFFLPLVPVGDRRRTWVCESCGIEVDGRVADGIRAAGSASQGQIHCVHCGGMIPADGTRVQAVTCPRCGRTFTVKL